MSDLKFCLGCKQTLPVEEFNRNAAMSDALQITCRDCQWERRQRRTDREMEAKYGITPETYWALFDAQNGCCAICGMPETRKRQGRVTRLVIDHCHKTGRVRGLLCSLHNVLIGQANDDPELLRRAVEYLESTTTPSFASILDLEV